MNLLSELYSIKYRLLEDILYINISTNRSGWLTTAAVCVEGKGAGNGLPCVKKSGQIEPHSKQLSLGYVWLGYIRIGLLGLVC